MNNFANDMYLFEKNINLLDKDNLKLLFKIIYDFGLPCLYNWLLAFYLMFHCWLNITAELLKFGDR